MSAWLWVDGHLSWPAFFIVVYTLLGLLVTDLLWRLVKVRSIVLLPLALAIWCVGVAVVWSSGFA